MIVGLQLRVTRPRQCTLARALALISKTSRCRICGVPLGDEPIVATSGVFFPPDHGLFEFCDAGLHEACFENWRHRDEFSRAYINAQKRRYRRSATWHIVLEKENVVVAYGTGPEEVKVHVTVRISRDRERTNRVIVNARIGRT